MKRGSDFEQALGDDELLDCYSRVLLMDGNNDLAYWKTVRDYTRELIYRDLLTFAVYDE